MVIENPYNRELESPPWKEQRHFAKPMDRVLASLFDFLFHTPLFTFFCFILIYRFNLLKITIATTSEKMAVLLQIIWIIIVGTIILQSIYLKLWNKTPGMRLLKLQLRSLNTSELSWQQCLLRSTLWCGEVFLLGIPLLAILSHPKRRAIHDRASETEIYSLKTDVAFEPLAAEKSMAHFIMTALIMLSLGWVTALFSLTHKSLKDGSMALAEWREQGQLCSEVDDLSQYSSIDVSNLNTRLDFVIGLFFLEQLDQSCLRNEIDFAILKNLNKSLVWVGRALLSVPYSKERKAYIENACREDSKWCHSALFFEEANLDDAKKFLNQVSQKVKLDNIKKVNKRDNDSDLIAYNAAKLIVLNRLGAVEEAKQALLLLQSNGLRATGLVSEHLKLAVRSNPNETNIILDGIKSVVMEKDYLRLNSEICLRQLESGCRSNLNECEMMRSLLPGYKESLSDIVVDRALYKSAICKKDFVEDMEYWTLISDETMQNLLNITQTIFSPTTSSKGLAQLRDFIKDQSNDISLRFDALQVLMTYSNYDRDWELIPVFWSQLHWTQPIYLQASEWILRKAKGSNQEKFISSLSETFTQIPGLNLTWNLLKAKKADRIPAAIKGK